MPSSKEYDSFLFYRENKREKTPCQDLICIYFSMMPFMTAPKFVKRVGEV